MENITTNEPIKHFETLKTQNNKPEKEIEKLKKNIEKNNEDLESMAILKDQWKECAEYYAEKFQMAYKGFLMMNGKTENESYQESLKVLEKISSLNGH